MSGTRFRGCWVVEDYKSGNPVHQLSHGPGPGWPPGWPAAACPARQIRAWPAGRRPGWLAGWLPGRPTGKAAWRSTCILVDFLKEIREFRPQNPIFRALRGNLGSGKRGPAGPRTPALCSLILKFKNQNIFMKIIGSELTILENP